MKGKLTTAVAISENEMLSIGTEIEITNGWCGCDEYYYQCEIPGGRQVVIGSKSIEITDHRPYINWEQRRYELAKDILSGMLPFMTCKESGIEKGTTLAVKAAAYLADALIKELKSSINY